MLFANRPLLALDPCRDYVSVRRIKLTEMFKITLLNLLVCILTQSSLMV